MIVISRVLTVKSGFLTRFPTAVHSVDSPKSPFYSRKVGRPSSLYVFSHSLTE